MLSFLVKQTRSLLSLKFLLEVVVVGILVVAVGSLVGYLLSKTQESTMIEKCKDWNKNHIMEISLFLTGALVHIICEFVGINRWYCSKGYACLRAKQNPKILGF